MKKIALLIFFTSVSCGKQRIEYSIKNESETTYDSIDLHCLRELKIYEFKPYESQTGIVENSNLIKDGDCEIRVYKNGIFRSHRFGYFTNKNLSSEAFRISITNDTIQVVQTTVF